MDRLLTWLQRPIDLLLWLSLVAGFLMMAHVTVDVAARYLLNRPLEGTTEIVAAYYMVAVAYCPWAFLASRDRHIVAGMFQHIGTPRFDFWLDIAVKLFTAVAWRCSPIRLSWPRCGRRGQARCGSPAPCTCRSGPAGGSCRCPASSWFSISFCA
jgi:hypothetical protein